jgi:hypothetical protein
MNGNTHETPSPASGPARETHFDRLLGSLVGLPDTLGTAATTVQTVEPLSGNAQTFIVRTFRQREKGDYIFVQYVDGSGAVRLVLPPDVSRLISRHRDALTTRARKKASRNAAAERKAAGILPGFMRNPGNGRRGAKRKDGGK